MMEDNQMAYVERGAVEAVLRIVHLLEEAGNEKGALRELAHFMEKMRDRVMVPLETVIEQEHDHTDDFPLVVRLQPERFRLIS